MIRVEIRGLDGFARQVSSCRQVVGSTSKEALLQSAEDLKVAAKGAFLPEGAQGGNAARPIRRSGGLAESISVRASEKGTRVEVGTDLEYGRYLEFGTRSMAPRPWLGPAAAASRAGLRARLISALQTALQAK